MVYDTLISDHLLSRFIRLGKPEEGTDLFGNECLKWPGFIEFDDVNCKVLTYSAVNQCAPTSDANVSVSVPTQPPPTHPPTQ